MDRRKIERPDGSVTLVGSGPAGAVTLDAWTYQGHVIGILGLHRAGDATGDKIPSACEYLPGGLCYPDPTYRHSRKAAEALIAYRDEEAWAAVEEGYLDRIEGAGA